MKPRLSKTLRTRGMGKTLLIFFDSFSLDPQTILAYQVHITSKMFHGFKHLLCSGFRHKLCRHTIGVVAPAVEFISDLVPLTIRRKNTTLYKLYMILKTKMAARLARASSTTCIFRSKFKMHTRSHDIHHYLQQLLHAAAVRPTW